MGNIIQAVIEWYMSTINYFTVFLLMTIESTFIPFPSEAVIPVAAYKAAQGELNLFGVFFSGTIGALIGAYINFYLSKYLGRPIIYKFAESKLGKLCMLSKEKVIRAENYFIKHGNASTFIGRLVPVVRQLISIPAGLANMNFRNFTFYTFAGAGIWNIILSLIGYFLYEIKDIIFPYLKEILLGLGVLFVLYLIVIKITKKSDFE